MAKLIPWEKVGPGTTTEELLGRTPHIPPPTPEQSYPQTESPMTTKPPQFVITNTGDGGNR